MLCGNPTTYRGYTMTWQGRRLTGAAGNGNTLTYSYDENGLRTQKTVNGTATQYRSENTIKLIKSCMNDPDKDICSAAKKTFRFFEKRSRSKVHH